MSGAPRLPTIVGSAGAPTLFLGKGLPMPERRRTARYARYATTKDPIVQAGRLEDREVMRLLNALSAGMGYVDTDHLTPEEQANYKKVGQDLLMWATQARVQVALVEMAIQGKVVIKWTPEGWQFKQIGDRAN